MVSALELLASWVVVSTVALLLIKKYTPYGERLGGTPPLVLLRSRLGIDIIDRISRFSPRNWERWGDLGYGLSLVGLLLGFLLIIQTALFAITDPRSSGLQDPKNALVIPGVSDFLPLSAAPEILLALLLALVVHEAGHGILSRVGGIEVEATGLVFFAGLPVGAFVEPDGETEQAASRKSRLRMFAAGIMNNLALTVVALFLLSVPFTALIAPAPGGPVGATLPSSSAQEAGIEGGDRIVQVDGTPVETTAETRDAIRAGGEQVTVTLSDGTTETIEKQLLVTSVAERTPDALGTGDVVVAVDGMSVNTEEQYQTALSDASGETVTLTLQDGEEVSVPAGVTANVQERGALAEAGAPTETQITITAVEGERVYTGSQLNAAIGSYDAGETVSVSTLVAGEERTYEVTLSENGLGVATQTGLGTLSVDDTGIRYYPAERYLQLLSFTSGGDSSVLTKFISFLVFPAAGQAGGLFNFAGFTPDIHNFYVTAGPDALAGVIFFLASLMFWTAWININLAIFNCIPTYGLDGGHILRDTLNAISDRLPGLEAGDSVTSYVNHTVKLMMLIGLFLMLFGPSLF